MAGLISQPFTLATIRPRGANQLVQPWATPPPAAIVPSAAAFDEIPTRVRVLFAESVLAAAAAWKGASYTIAGGSVQLTVSSVTVGDNYVDLILNRRAVDGESLTVALASGLFIGATTGGANSTAAVGFVAPISAAAPTTDTARLAQYIRGKPHMEALLAAFKTQADDLASALSQLDLLRRLADCTGEQLDQFGAIVGQGREGTDDATFRARIQARIKVNNASGTVPEVLDVMSLIKPVGGTLTLRDEPPAGFVLFLGGVGVNAATAALLAEFLREARAAGVRGVLHWMNTTPAASFTFDGTAAQALDAGQFGGAAV